MATLPRQPDVVIYQIKAVDCGAKQAELVKPADLPPGTALAEFVNLLGLPLFNLSNDLEPGTEEEQQKDIFLLSESEKI